MAEALARMRREPTLTAPAREPTRARSAKPTQWAWRKWAPKSAGGYAGLILSAVLAGIVLNAVSLQHEHRPTPLIAPEASPSPAPAPMVGPALPPQPTAVTQAAPAVAQQPSATPQALPPSPKATPAHKADPILDLLRNGGGADEAKLVISVQRALVKLGYDLEPDGVMGGETEKALKDFEKAHSFPITTELTPRLLAKLGLASRER